MSQLPDAGIFLNTGSAGAFVSEADVMPPAARCNSGAAPIGVIEVLGVHVPGHGRGVLQPRDKLSWWSATSVVAKQGEIEPARHTWRVIDDGAAHHVQERPKNPDYAPTQENVRRMYLAKQSRASPLIPQPLVTMRC